MELKESSILFSEKEEHFPNEYFAPELFNAIEKLMYLFPFWSGIFLQREGKTRDTNADVENWFGIVKSSILKKEKNLPASVFIRKLHVQIAGRTMEYTLPPRVHKGKKHSIEIQEEMWSKTPTKSMKSKYFNSPRSVPTPRSKNQKTRKAKVKVE